MLPRSVEQVEPPPSLKRSLMEVVEREAQEAARRPRRGPGGAYATCWADRCARSSWPPACSWGCWRATGSPSSAGDEGGRSVVAAVNRGALPEASARLEIQGDGKRGAILEVRGMPTPQDGQVYQAWIQRDGMIEPEPTFEVGPDGRGAVAVPEDLSDAKAVMVTQEPRGGSRAPSGKPLLTVSL